MGRFYQGCRGLSPSGASRDPAASSLLVFRDPVVTGGAVLLADWIEELRRRRVLRALLAYGVVVFAVLQVIEPVLHGLRLPEWSLSAVVIGLGVGFPLVGTIAWLLDAQRRPASPGAYSARVRHRRLAYGLGALALVAALALGVTLYRGRPSVPAIDGPPSIAVLPFANLSGNPEEAYFADGLTEEIQSALAQIPGLRVIGRTSSFAFKGRTQDLKEVARKLGVTSVLEGSVRHAGSRLRITAQIVDARDGYHLWSQSFDREMGDVFAVQDEIGRAVASALQLKLLPRSRGPDRMPVDPEVTNQYLLARRRSRRGRPWPWPTPGSATGSRIPPR
jgi:TolB-like protein